jgi:hypothetical protein
MINDQNVRRIAVIGWKTIDRCARVPAAERSRRAPLTAPRRAERRGTPAWSSRSLAERRPLRRLNCQRKLW